MTAEKLKDLISKAEEKIAKNEKERKQRMAEFAASFQFNYS